MGCFKAMFVQAGCAVMLVAAIALGIIYRHQLMDYYHQWRPASGEVYVSPSGSAVQASGALERLGRSGGPAYEDLSAAQIAALVDAALEQAGRRVFDSVQVALIPNEIRVKGSLDLSNVPRNLLGPLGGMVNDREPAAIGGPLAVDSAGRLVLTVTYLKLRDFPFPKGTIPRILEAAHVPGAHGADVPLPVRTRLGDVRVSPSSVRVYRASAN